MNVRLVMAAVRKLGPVVVSPGSTWVVAADAAWPPTTEGLLFV